MLMSSAAPLSQLENESEFIARHIGISDADEKHMLSVIGQASRRALIESIVPASIARSQAMKLPAPVTEASALAELKADLRHFSHLNARSICKLTSVLITIFICITSCL